MSENAVVDERTNECLSILNIEGIGQEPTDLYFSISSFELGLSNAPTESTRPGLIVCQLLCTSLEALRAQSFLR